MDDTGNKHVTQSLTNAGGVPEPNTTLQILSGETLIYTPPDMDDAKRRPMVTLGNFRDGTPILHFRNYERTRRGDYRITREGAAFTFREFREKISTKVAELCARRPDLFEPAASADAEASE